MLKSKWMRRLAAASTLLVVGVACAALFAQDEKEAKPAEAKPAKTGESPRVIIRADGAVTAETRMEEGETKQTLRAQDLQLEPQGLSPGATPVRRPSALQKRPTNHAYSSVRLEIPLETDRYPLGEIYEVVPAQAFAVVARKTNDSGETTESLIAANCRLERAEMEVRPGPDRTRLIVSAPLPNADAPLRTQAKIDQLAKEGYEFQLDGLRLEAAKPEEVRIKLRLTLKTDEFPLELLQANVGNENVSITKRNGEPSIDAIYETGCRIEEVRDEDDGEAQAEVIVSFDKGAPRPSPKYLKQADVDSDLADGIKYALHGLFDPNNPNPEKTFMMRRADTRSDEPALESYRLVMLPIDRADYPRGPATVDRPYDVQVISDSGEAVPFATQCLIHIGHEPRELQDKQMLIALPIGFDYRENRKVSPKLIETLEQLGKKFQLTPHQEESKVAAAPAKATNSLVAPTAPAGNSEPSDANVLSQPRRIEVRLDPKLVDEELLEANIGNGMIQVLAIRRGADPGTAGPVDVAYQMATGCQLIEVKHVGLPHPTTPKLFVGHPVAVLLVSEPSPQTGKQLTQKEVDDALEAGARFRLVGLVDSKSPPTSNALAFDPPRVEKSADAPSVTIRVPLDANTYSMEWLNHNKPNQLIQLFAGGTGITKASEGFHSFGCNFAIRKFLPDSLTGRINLVDLEVVSLVDPTSPAAPPVTEQAMQEKVDELRAKKFRFVLQGLVPLGEPVPKYATATPHADTRPNSSGIARFVPGSGYSRNPYGAPGGNAAMPRNSSAFNPTAPAPFGSRFSLPNAPNANGPTQRFGVGPANQFASPAAPPSNSASTSPYYGKATATPYGGASLAPTGSAPSPYTQAGNSQFKPPGVPGSNAWAPGYANSSNPQAAAPAAVPDSPPGATNAYVPATGYSSAASPHFSIPAPRLTAPSGASHNYSAASNYAVPAYAPNVIASPKYAPASSQPSNAKINRPLEQKKRQALARLEKAKTDAEKAQAREELRQALTEVFTADMKQRDNQARDIEARVKKLRQQYDAREDAKDEIIELQLKLLEKQAEGLEFPQ
ncbi:hypothetical protein [Blastopirellula retiformator]|uniref:Uncharacterized protein n=1 Tax=Blastopirellula retiformator TaxID=2527970 RepID=A0A5C5V4D3_9BACT|nr:hypothetical protein [Blastopirellula retiformator]TWT32617.1 hypothetical protein Enr8_24220 [Blastopirellula retiformator]